MWRNERAEPGSSPLGTAPECPVGAGRREMNRSARPSGCRMADTWRGHKVPYSTVPQRNRRR